MAPMLRRWKCVALQGLRANIYNIHDHLINSSMQHNITTLNTIITYRLPTVNQLILAAIKFGVSQNKVIYVNLAAIKFGVSPRPVYAVYDRRICWRRQILAKRRNSPNSPNIIARQNLLIYSILLM